MLIFVINQQRDGRSGRPVFKNTGEDLYPVGFAALCGIAALSGFSPVQVFLNILDNAAKHGGEGKKITASIHHEAGNVVVRIRDFGPGIPEDELPHVKMKFYKGSSKARGNGIGLAVCEEIVTRHEGTLTIGNAEGGGCLVTIRLPIET